MLLRIATLLLLAGYSWSFEESKDAFLHFEMGNYFLKGQDWKNAQKYYEKAEGKLEFAELDIVLCRNLATVHLMQENKSKALITLGRCIQKIPYSTIENSQPLREVYQMYAQMKADEINPKILDYRRTRARERAEAMRHQKNMPPPSKMGPAPTMGFQK